jgi:lipid-binding SYLF domain-containing protein
MVPGRSKSISRRLALAGGVALLAVVPAACASAPEAPGQPIKRHAGLERDADEAYRRLISQNPGAQAIAAKSLAVLIFPKVTKAGFMVGGQYGKGVLREHGATTGYYSTGGASVGFQVGGQTYSYVLFFMNQKALDYLKSSNGWAIGTGPTVVVADKGMAAEGSTTTLRDDIYAFIFGQQGLMAGIGLQGTKISRAD